MPARRRAHQPENLAAEFDGGSMVRRFLADFDLDAGWLSRRLKCSRATVHHWLSGRTPLPLPVGEYLCGLRFALAAISPPDPASWMARGPKSRPASPERLSAPPEKPSGALTDDIQRPLNYNESPLVGLLGPTREARSGQLLFKPLTQPVSGD